MVKIDETKPKDTVKFVKAGLRVPSNRLSDSDFKQGDVFIVSYNKKSIILTKKE